MSLLKKKFFNGTQKAALTLSTAALLGLSACNVETCFDQVACGSATRGVVMALPEFAVPALGDVLPNIDLGAGQVRAALIQAGVPAAVLDSLGVDFSDIDTVLDALSDRGVTVNVDGIVEDLLVDVLDQLETEVNSQIAASMPAGSSAAVTLLGVEDLVVDIIPGDIDGSILAALDQLSMNAKLTLPIPSIEEMMAGEGGASGASSQGSSNGSSGLDVDTLTSIIESIELSELGLRTLAPTEAPVTEVKLLNPKSRTAALSASCQSGQTQFDLLEKLKVQLKQDLPSAQNQTLFNYSGAVGKGTCGVVLQAKTPVDLLDALITGATLTLDLTTGFPIESARILPAAKVRFTGGLDLPGTITTLMGAATK